MPDHGNVKQALTHFIPCGVWEAVYIIEGLLKNTSEVQPTTGRTLS